MKLKVIEKYNLNLERNEMIVLRRILGHISPVDLNEIGFDQSQKEVHSKLYKALAAVVPSQ